MEISYRKGSLADLDAISAFVGKAIEEMDKAGIYQWDKIYPTKETFRADIEEGTLFVGCIGEAVAVVYVLNQEFDEAYRTGKWQDESKSFCILHRLCVNPEYQNHGIARQTVEYLEQSVKESGIEAIRLDAFTQNPYALKLYETCGYQTAGKVMFRKGAFYLMEKYL